MTIIFTSGRLQRYNGGTKLYNVIVQLLREHSYDACIATQDGQYDRWLVEHQPVISYAELWAMDAPTIVTGWLATQDLDALTRERPLYYFDAELKWTLQFRSALDRLLGAGRISSIATHNRYIQAWYMATYGITPALIHQWSDTSIFYPDEAVRVPGRIGCMPDDPGSCEVYERLCTEFGPQVVIVRGDEQQVADTMRTVDVFAGINPGKHPLWGEGFAITQQEAMHCGCVVVAFDVLGNREYLVDDWNARLVERGNEAGLVAAIHHLLSNDENKERLRRNSTALAQGAFSARGKIELIRRWLQL